MDDLLLGRGGHRQSWYDMPVEARAVVERRFGAGVVSAADQHGGFSPAVAALLTLADGRMAFVKGLSAEANPASTAMYRREAEIMAHLPAGTPAPRLLWFEDGDWILLAFEAVPGRSPAVPWCAEERDRVFTAVAELAAIPAPATLSSVAETDWLRNFRVLAGGDDPRLSTVDPWAAEHLDQLAALEDHWRTAATGDALAHGDLRADNMLLTEDRVVFVDWPSAVRAVPWYDLVGMLPSVGMQGGGDPAELFDRHPLSDGADPAAVTAVLAAITGYFVCQALLPAPPSLPNLRRFQAAQGAVALSWLRRRLDR